VPKPPTISVPGNWNVFHTEHFEGLADDPQATTPSMPHPGATWCLASVAIDDPPLGAPYKFRDGYSLTLTLYFDGNYAGSTVWSSYGANGLVVNTRELGSVANPDPQLALPLNGATRVHATLSSDAIPSAAIVLFYGNPS
jgi:hypothetical protein